MKDSKKEALDIAYNLITARQLTNGRMGLNDDNYNTNLISKNYSPMTIRKYNIVKGWPMFIGLIIDENISDIDHVVNGVFEACNTEGMIENNLQDLRNFTGILSETLINYYNNKKENCVEGVIITLYVDKAYIQNAYGDFMNHSKCLNEYALALNILPHV